MKIRTIPLLGFSFVDEEPDRIFEVVKKSAHSSYKTVITPNVDFVVRLNEQAHLRHVYQDADIQICDSKVLGLMLRMLGHRVICLPGANLTARLLDESDRDLRIALVGPSCKQLRMLRERYPQQIIHRIDAPARFEPGDAHWEECLQVAAAADWNVLLICLGSPKQEHFAAQLRSLRHREGVALCVGASIDFLTGVQARAPDWMQRIALEWLFRLITNPQRMFWRYMIDNPKIFAIVFQEARLRYQSQRRRN
jgi:exopolysaccharide biosynthesis WecB/TagA/CpsF family protein